MSLKCVLHFVFCGQYITIRQEEKYFKGSRGRSMTGKDWGYITDVVFGFMFKGITTLTTRHHLPIPTQPGPTQRPCNQSPSENSLYKPTSREFDMLATNQSGVSKANQSTSLPAQLHQWLLGFCLSSPPLSSHLHSLGPDPPSLLLVPFFLGHSPGLVLGWLHISASLAAGFLSVSWRQKLWSHPAWVSVQALSPGSAWLWESLQLSFRLFYKREQSSVLRGLSYYVKNT